MRPLLTFLSLAVGWFLSSAARGDDTDFVIVGYLPDYRVASIDPERLKPLTDLVYFSLRPTADGGLDGQNIPPATLKTLHEIKRIAKCRLLICVGGWERSDGFAEMAKSDEARRRFVAELRLFCQRNDFDGVDYDWEHPRDDGERAAYSQLIADTKEAFRQPGYSVTVAQAGWQDLGKATYAALDRVHLMSYDHDFPQATLAKATEDVERLIQWGCPAEKIAMGLPFYGRNREGAAKTYQELVILPSAKSGSDTVNGFAFNSESTVTNKVKWAADKQLAGVMIWEVGQDASDPRRSLLQAISRTALSL
ncbi:glycoside hydrolase family 18 protein [Stieleria varia]|uniref:chitinase n=1 Tax=Stieleria varia TaxID=2528005 RepID=A0A5C6AZ02_9BACT|nr:glycoside hydrolase family 18 protein [Stieleria varia]TWU04910.1 Chitinase A1 precursor [Stieleria varia]